MHSPFVGCQPSSERVVVVAGGDVLQAYSKSTNMYLLTTIAH